MAAWVWYQVKSSGIYGGQSTSGVDFLQVIQFPMLIHIPLKAPYLSIIQGL